MPQAINVVRPHPSQTPAFTAPQMPPPSPRPQLNYDVLRVIFGFVDGRDMAPIAQVNRLWNEAATSRPILAPWYAASNKCVQNFVRNKRDSNHYFTASQRPHQVGLRALLEQQTALQLVDVDQGLNAHRAAQVFDSMPALQSLQLNRTTQAHGRGAAVTCWTEAPTLHDKVRRQSVPPELWTGALPAQITHLDLSHFALFGAHGHIGRPTFEHTLVQGLLENLAGHHALTHLRLGSCFVEQLMLPPQLTHLALTRSLKIGQAFVSRHLATARLLSRLPVGLTHLDAGDEVCPAAFSHAVLWPAGMQLEHLSICIDDDMSGLSHILRPPLASLSLSCQTSERRNRSSAPLAYPSTLRALRLDLRNASQGLREALLARLPQTLTSLSLDVQQATDLAPLLAQAEHWRALRTLHITLWDAGPKAIPHALLARVPSSCRQVHLNADAHALGVWHDERAHEADSLMDLD